MTASPQLGLVAESTCLSPALLVSWPERVAALRRENERLTEAVADLAARGCALEDENAFLRRRLGPSRWLWLRLAFHRLVG